MNVRYEEKISSSVFVIAALLIVCLILAFALFSQFAGRAVPLTLSTKIIFAAILFISAIILVCFRRLTIAVTDNQLILAFGYLKKKFYLGNIENVEISEYKFSNYLGYGIRYGLDKTIGYVPRGGRGLKIKFKNERREYFFITDKPEELKKFLVSGK